MIHRLLMIAGLAGIGALTMPALTARFLDTPDHPVQAVPQPDQTKPAVRPAALRPPAAGGREVMLAADSRGHFQAVVEINGRPVDGLIDTGATSVAINETTARRIGLSASSLTDSVSVSTANGAVRGARAMLKRVKIGSIAIDNVEAIVLPDTALSGMLVGMSFLGRLSSFGVEDGALKLRR